MSLDGENFVSGRRKYCLTLENILFEVGRKFCPRLKKTFSSYALYLVSYVRLKWICSRLESILCQVGEHFLSDWRTFRFRLEDILFQIGRFFVCYWRCCIHCDILLTADEFHSVSRKKDFFFGGGGRVKTVAWCWRR
jgi:hypothetical protein